MEGKPHIATLILAAGASTRMGQPKQLLPWKSHTLLEHTIAQAKEVSSEVIVVLGAHLAQIKPIVGNVPCIENEHWEQGMGTSIAKGIQYLAAKKHIDAVLVLLGDQPLLDADYLEQLIRAYQKTGSGIVATRYSKKNGVPAIFDRTFFPALQELDGDHGARRLLEAQKNHLVSLSPEGRAVDIDTLETYHKIKDNEA